MLKMDMHGSSHWAATASRQNALTEGSRVRIS